MNTTPRSLRRRAGASAKALGEVFRNPDLRRLQLASSGYFTGDWAYTVALAVFAYDVGGAAAVGLVGLIRMLPAGLAAPFGSMLADRYQRERVLIMIYVASAAVVGLSAVVYLAWGSAVAIFVLAGLISLVSAVLRPAQWALMPLLARTPRELAASNAASSMIEGLSTFVGPALGAVLLASGNPGVVFGTSAALFGWSALLTTRITSEITAKIRPVREHGPSWRQALAGFGVLAREPQPRLIVSLFGAQTFVRGLLNVLIVVLAVELLGLGGSGVGTLHAAAGIGGLIGGVVALGLAGRRRLAGPLGLGLLLWGPPIALLAVLVHPAAAILLLVVPGIGNSIQDVAGFTLMQRITRNEVLGRVFGVMEGVALSMIGLGSIAAAPLIGWLGARGALVATGLILPVSVVLAYRGLRRIDADSVVPEREVRVLESLPLFEPLPVVTLEQVARRASHARVADGVDICREGEEGDHFYVILDGQVRVHRAGTVAAVLGPGEYFGEIALLRDVPRTATVTALEDTELLTLERDEFVIAVTGHAQTIDTADRVVTERLRDLGSEDATT